MEKKQLKKEILKLLPKVYDLNIQDDWTDTATRLEFERLWVQYNKMATKKEQVILRTIIFDYEG